VLRVCIDEIERRVGAGGKRNKQIYMNVIYSCPGKASSKITVMVENK